MRIDQLLALAWKFLLPVSLISLLATTLEVYFLRAPPIPESALNKALGLIQDLAVERQQDILARQRDSRRARLAQQRETLNRTFGAKIDAARRRADAAPHERIKRMQQGRLRNLRDELDDRLGELRAEREPTAEIQLIAAAVFTAN